MSLGQSHQQQQMNVNSSGRDGNLNSANVSVNYQPQSSSCLDLINNNNNLSTRDKERLKALLPGYRPAPDYETAVNQQQQQQQQQKYRANERVASDPHINIRSGSHPDIHRVTADTMIFGPHLQRRNPDVIRTTNLDGLTQQLQMMRMTNRPPPYPVNRFNSTPDLALASHRALYHQAAYMSGGSSPDLLSTRTFSNAQHPSNTLRFRHAQSHNGNLNSGQLNGSIDPIYENQIYESRTDISNGKMRARALSNQSSAGVMRFTHQQTQRQPGHNPIAMQLLPNAHSLESINRNSLTPVVTPNMIDQQSRPNRRHVQFDPINRSQSTNVLDSYSNTSNTTFDSSMNSNLDKRDTKEKKKRRWKFWGGKGKVSLSSKTKGDRSERDKGKETLTKEQEIDSRHRWSTGLPRLPLSTTISKEKLCEILETKLADPQLYVEFERIPKRKVNACYDCALLVENRLRNFDPNFLPYDENRVRLTPTLDNRSGYYNASYVTATVGSKQRFYIIAQSPHVETALETFLQCIWEADVYLLVQLSDEVNYVPPTCDKCLEYGQYKIWKEFSEVTDQCVTSKLRLYHAISRRYRSVWHLRYYEWTVQNCPKDVGHFSDFLEELCSVRLASINEVPPGHNTNPPVMIHCSEGGGKTGVTLLADLLLYTLDNNQDLDIPRVLSQLREQRDHILPSLAQYKFVYALLINYLKQSRLI